jgi:hypothetical protein
MKRLAASGLGSAAAVLTHVIPAAGWIVLGLLGMATVALVCWAIQEDNRARRLAQILHGVRNDKADDGLGSG